mmetsp:Transcript_1891/g.1312  ORF Transcript_1891/g.1312 Transcript_1891/m.1312 type:complete len:152 (-) Transcript_1891:127-582(-)|eukprot:CAMPEP_0201281572 /NCGR_PEP_ID=MMETSP1317-20130820/3357_1 /ASSEMBLY_ACC=CAM_ASM_000770 /TAXON_ID=187299 /ORGANISM="Undescribed Undescribed, Strain Undescribed" /LENGTH=151 /DNA_ID=CAMNT_0047591769 /DNA_START=293 /DNA_END=748 /DNA_ORIENTATION=+
MGDATNLVLVLAGELLQQAEGLIRMGLHPSEIILGYEKALKYCLEQIDSQVAFRVSDISDYEQVSPVLSCVLATKVYGYETQLADLVVDACTHCFKDGKFLTSSVRVTKVLGATLADSKVVRGMLLTTDTLGTVKHAKQCKVAVFGCPIDP